MRWTPSSGRDRGKVKIGPTILKVTAVKDFTVAPLVAAIGVELNTSAGVPACITFGTVL